jgi:hypothetical protein
VSEGSKSAHEALSGRDAETLLWIVRRWPFLGDSGWLGRWWRDPEWEIRRLTPIALAWLRPEALIRLAPRMFQAPEVEIRAAVAEAVGTAALLRDLCIETPRVAVILRKAETDPGESVRAAARAAIELLASAPPIQVDSL